MDLQRLNEVKNNSKVLYNKEAVEKALDTLAVKLTQDYADKNPIILSVMNGGLVFAGKLLPKLNFPLQIDYCHATRYRGSTQGHEIQWKALPQCPLLDRHVLLLDDILDEGHTVNAIVQACASQSPASVKTVMLIEKLHDRKATPDMRPDYCELTTPDQYVFGCGMDYQSYWRNTDDIYILEE